MMEKDYIYVLHDICTTRQGKDGVAEKSENKLFKYSELGNFGIKT